MAIIMLALFLIVSSSPKPVPESPAEFFCVQASPHYWGYVETEFSDPRINGTFSSKENKIQIRRSLKGDTREQVLIHECIHQILLFAYPKNSYYLDESLVHYLDYKVSDILGIKPSIIVEVDYLKYHRSGLPSYYKPIESYVLSLVKGDQDE